MKKKLVFFMIMVLLLSNTVVAYAKIPIEQCPIVLNAHPLDQQYSTPYEIHKYYPNGDDYYSWFTFDCGMYYFHETWTCSKCGNIIAKDTFLGSVTDILGGDILEKE